MLVFTTAAELRSHIKHLKVQNPSLKIGFVPTMGALHEGHMELINQARVESTLVVASIFVNPTQFNDPKDLERYPRTPERDLQLLKEHHCDVVYMPSVDDIYPEGIGAPYSINLNGADQKMEGVFRPGHFQGVARVVERLFRLIEPDEAFFGRKDFQQVAVIKQMIGQRQLTVAIHAIPTVRSDQGLALSSRNALLSDDQKKEALVIYKTLSNALEWSKYQKSTQKLREDLVAFFQQGSLRLEYLEIVDDVTLETPAHLDRPCTCCIAAWCGQVRLIDNIQLS